MAIALAAFVCALVPMAIALAAFVCALVPMEMLSVPAA